MLNRRPDRVEPASGIEWIRGDALVAADVAAAARGASLLVHAVNPPGYRDWGKLVLPMLDSTIAAARANGARILLPGTVYNYGPDAFPDIREDAPQRPRTAKGRIRAEMERRLREAAASGEARVLIVRAGDFFGPQPGNSWFSQGLVKPGQRPRVVSYPGRPGVGHQWAYLPDVAETMVRLVGKEGLDDLASFHMEGHWDPDGTRMTDAIRRVLGDPAVRVRPLPWWAMRLASPFVPVLRELLEMKYLWDRPVRLRNDRLLATLGREARTPLDEAVRTTLAAIGCLEGAGSAAPSAGMLASSRSWRRFRAFRSRERNGNIVAEQVRRGFVRNRTLRSERGRTERERRRGISRDHLILRPARRPRRGLARAGRGTGALSTNRDG